MICKETLEKFCADDLAKYGISKPFTVGDFTYATNGHILVQVPKIEGIAGDDSKLHMGCEKILADGHKNAVFSTRRFLIEDPVRTTLKCDCSSHACPTCYCMDSCEDCENGVITKEERKDVLIDGISFDPWYIELIQSLPGLEISEAKDREPLAFRFDGGLGLLMPRAETGYTCFRYPKARAA